MKAGNVVLKRFQLDLPGEDATGTTIEEAAAPAEEEACPHDD